MVQYGAVINDSFAFKETMPHHLPRRRGERKSMMRSARLALQHAWLLLGILTLLLSSCATSTSIQHITRTPSQAPPSPTPRPVLTPVTGLLDPVPADCQPVSPPATLTYKQFGGGFIGPVTLHGGGQAWLTRNITALHLNQDGPQPMPETKVLWATGPNPTHTITVQGQDQHTGTPVWFRIDQSSPATTLELVPGESDRDGTTTPDGSTWEIWGTSLIFVKAGCYQLEARWPGGKWVMTIAAGR